MKNRVTLIAAGIFAFVMAETLGMLIWIAMRGHF